MAFDFNRDPERMLETAALNDATSTSLSSFIAHGGKFIIFHGDSDPVFSINASIGWYEKVSARYPQTANWARLFRVPGMNHCMGGPATDQFDALAAIQNWREGQQAPDQIPAHGRAFPNVVRPLCPYPKYARYTAGDPAKITSFVCE
jgi:feruloyl esterase